MALGPLTNGSFVCESSDHELAPDGLLHHLEPRVAEKLRELVGAVDDREVDDLKQREKC